MKIILRLGNLRFLLFTLILLAKSALAWYIVFEDGPSWTMLLTEIPFMWAVFCLIEWLASKRKLLYYTLADLAFTFLYFAVLMYFKYYGVIVTYHQLNQAGKVTEVGESTYSLMDPYYLLVFADIVILLFLHVRLRMKKKSGYVASRLLPYRKPAVLGILVLSVALCVFDIWPNRASMNESKQAEEMGILNYEFYTLLSDGIENSSVETVPVTQAAIDELKGVHPDASPVAFGAAKGKNVIIIQMESFQNFLIGLKVDGQEITPNINKLADENYYYKNFYSSAGSGTTSDAEYVVNTSLYVPAHEPAVQALPKNGLPSLPKLLQKSGYETATFHTNDVQFWNRSELYPALGWQHYYDKSYFGDGDHVAFGASDSVLFSKTMPKLEEMSASGKPFYAQIITMSAHHPYNIPESKMTLDLPDNLDGTLLGRYLQAQHFADQALGQFIDEMKSSGMWDNSMVMFYGDHQGLPVYTLDKNEKTSIDAMIGHEYSYADMFNIPFILHAPGVTGPSVITETGGQIDILPTVANLAGVSLADQIHFGTDLLNLKGRPNMLPVRHFLPTGSVITDSDVFVPGNAFEDGTNYPLVGKDTGGRKTTEDEFNRTLELLKLSDSYSQTLRDEP
ncbi:MULTISPECIES: LTA synthase family protein [Paenibacillus]|uniref:LTA synthase family protein n=1 Tax=Paenibacillus TaxID=44249 RepID=UPI00038FBB62|nr:MULTISPECIES: LTA synthase family protein [Paenibacillus]KKC47881.1 sulfatase [Paenibacillus sp. D9]CDN41852.1 Sulfatase [Paenibacillus sp. P22]